MRARTIALISIALFALIVGLAAPSQEAPPKPAAPKPAASKSSASKPAAPKPAASKSATPSQEAAPKPAAPKSEAPSQEAASKPAAAPGQTAAPSPAAERESKLEDLTLLEVMKFKNGDAAVLALQSGERILVRVGDELGGGVVKVIRADEVLVEETVKDADGTEKKSQVLIVAQVAPPDPNQLFTIEVPDGPSEFTGRPISLDVVNQDLLRVLNVLAEQVRFNYVASGEVGAKVTMRVKDRPWNQVLDCLLTRTRHASIKDSGMIIITSRAALGPGYPPPQFKDRYSGYTANFDFTRFNLADALAIIAETSGKSLVVHPSVEGKVSIRATSAPWDMVLDHVLYVAKLDKIRQGPVILIAPKAVLDGPWAPLATGTYSGSPVTINFTNQDLPTVLETVVAASGKKLQIVGEPKGTITLALKNAPWDLALDIIVATHGLSKSLTDEAIEIVFPGPDGAPSPAEEEGRSSE